MGTDSSTAKTTAATDGIHIWGEDRAVKKSFCKTRNGFWFAGGLGAGKDLHPKAASALPVYKMKSAGVWRHETDFKSITFHDFAIPEI